MTTLEVILPDINLVKLYLVAVDYNAIGQDDFNNLCDGINIRLYKSLSQAKKQKVLNNLLQVMTDVTRMIALTPERSLKMFRLKSSFVQAQVTYNALTT